MAKKIQIEWSRVVVIGLIGAAVIGMLTMSFEWLFGTEGFWALMVYIAALILRGLQDVASAPGFIVAPVLVGLLLHMMIGIGLAALFVAVAAQWTAERNRLALAGTVYGAAVFVAMWFVVFPLVNDVMLRLDGPWYFVAHLLWGLSLGLMSAQALATPGTTRAAKPTARGTA